MSQDPEPLVLWKHEPKPQNPRPLKTWAKIQNLWSSKNMSQSPKDPWSSENMSQDPKILGLWKHEPGSKTFDPLKTWAKAQKSLVFWKHEPGSVVLQVSISCSHQKKKKKKKNLRAWTTSGPGPPTKRYIGNLPRDSVHILIHYMIICIFIYMHHTFTTVKYWLQS